MTTLFTVEQNGDALWWTFQQLSNGELEAGFIVQCVELGLVETSGEQQHWRFNSEGRLRLQKAWRLHRDLEVHVTNLPLVLQLLDELDELRQEAEQLRVRLQHWELVHHHESGS